MAAGVGIGIGLDAFKTYLSGGTYSDFVCNVEESVYTGTELATMLYSLTTGYAASKVSELEKAGNERLAELYNTQKADWERAVKNSETSYGKSSGNLSKPKGWKVGDPIDNLTKAGNEPSWSTVRARYWKNKAYYYGDDYLESDLLRMRKGKAPIDMETGVSMELHHKKGRDITNPHNIENIQEVWPWEHDEIDPYRHYTGPRPKGE